MNRSTLTMLFIGLFWFFKTAIGAEFFNYGAADSALSASGAASDKPDVEIMSLAAVSAHVVYPDIKAMTNEEEMTVSLPDGTSYNAIASEVKRHGQGNISWRGKLAALNGEQGNAVITVVDGVTAGYISTPNATYELQPMNENQSILVEVDPSLYPEDDHIDVADADMELDDYATGAFGQAGATFDLGAEPDVYDAPTKARALRESFDTSEAAVASEELAAIALDHAGNPQIDVMVVYTTKARNGAGGTANINAIIQNAVDVTNDAYANSLVPQRINLVHTVEVGYGEGSTLGDDLTWVRTDANVAALRNTHGADLVALITDTGKGYCGIAYVMRTVDVSFEQYGFSVTARGCAGGGSLTFPHELGHNMGLEHDPANGASPANASYPYAFGHYVSGQFRTIMSYSSECTSFCPRIAYFSNPSVSVGGFATGIADQRDNARALRNTDSVVAAFRAGTPGEPTLISPTGTIGDNTPNYRWYAVPTATWYALYVNDSTGNVINQWFTASDTGCAGGTGICSLTPATALADGAATWWVRAYNGNYGPWSHPKNFTVSTVPQKPTLISPSGLIFDSTPTYRWNAVPTATWYRLWVNDKNGKRIDQWYTAAQVGCPSASGTCSITPSVVLAAGAGKWWVQAYNGKYGPWSDGLGFTVIQFKLSGLDPDRSLSFNR